MSDFDKEAERERLREKYERDQKKREATEKMSDLLLKGATMTNAHCENCGDPIFRYEGQEFCPTCEQVVAGDGEAGAAGTNGATAEAATEESDTTDSGDVDDGSGSDEAESTGRSDRGTPGHIEIKRPSGPAAGEEAGDGGTGDGGTGDGESTTTDAGGSSPGPTDAGGSSSGAAAGTATPGEPRTGRSPEASAPATTTAGGEDGLAAARESLVRTLVAQSQQAEACEDPRRARDHLAAAREAAEALSALSY